MAAQEQTPGNSRALNLYLGGRNYRIRVPAEKEGTVRASVKAANEKIAAMRRDYPGLEEQDYIAMTLLLYAADSANNEPGPETQQALEDMTAQIEKALRK